MVGEPGLALARSQAKLAEMAGHRRRRPRTAGAVVFGLDDVSVSYSGTVAIRDVDIRSTRTLRRRSSARPAAARPRCCAA